MGETTHVLRDYQVAAATAILREFETVRSTLLVLPTGTGKTQVFCAIAADFLQRVGGKVLILAHRAELIYQAANRVHQITGIIPNIEMADQSAPDFFGDQSRVIVSTVQTQISRGGRMERFDPDDFSLVIVDEAHHAPAASWIKTLEHYKKCDRLKVLGVTATPDRADEEALGKVFETVAFDYELPDAIKDGWLVPILQQSVEVEGLDFSAIRTTAGDLNGADLAEVMEYENVLHGVATPTIELTGNRKTLVFAASVAHAERLAEIFNRHTTGCADWVCGKTPAEDRKKLVKRFADKEFRILCNVGVATEGWDDPGVEVIVMARPTKSRSLYAQMAGRATRPLPGIVDGPTTPELRRAAIAASAKPTMMILDFVGNAGRHKLISAADILGGNYTDEVKDRAKRNMKKSGEQGDLPSDIALELMKAQKQVDEETELRTRARLKAQARYSVTSTNPFDVFCIRPLPERGWDLGKQLSEKQRAVLEKQKIPGLAAMPYSQQKQLLTALFKRWDKGLASYAQLNLLRKRGVETPAEMTRDQASAAINEIATREHWKVRA